MDQSWWKRPSTLPLILVVMALLIITVGGTIRIHDAGESCPDWPQCFGTWGFAVDEAEQAAYWEANPDQIDSRGADHRYTIFEIFVEWFHRLLVGIIAVPILINAIVAQKLKAEYGEGVRNLAVVSGFLLIIQAIAGAITVYFDNADWTVAMHLSLASIFTSLLVWQYIAMRAHEGAQWAFLSTSKSFLNRQKKRLISITASVFILLILGAWVSSTAGGNYNQSCSIGFPNGWPKCQGSILPSIDGPGILVQMIHRFGAAIVGLILILTAARIRVDARDAGEGEAFSRAAEVVTGFWILNVFVGGMYIVFADSEEFPELISLIHLVFGVTSFIAAAVTLMMLRLAYLRKTDVIGEMND
ncbi:MAG: COX15/CtaA family protein [Candidatus Poseidoniaceae archaeon]|nr:COX15/CtaA family protein [Candidatus Poseidoniaceae archaeon]